MEEILLAAALVPAFALMYYVYKKDSVEKEPMRLIMRLFALGAIAGPIAAILESIAFEIFDNSSLTGTALLVCKYYIGVAAIEEGLKYLFLNTVRKNPEFNYVFDGIVYAVAVSLGFAALENVLYVMSGGLGVALTRALFSVPGHCADGVVMGCFFGLARQREVRGNRAGARLYYILAFVLPVIEHGFYDCALSTESVVLNFAALGVEIAFIALAAIIVNKVAKGDSAIYARQVAPDNVSPKSNQMMGFSDWQNAQMPSMNAQPQNEHPPMAQPLSVQPLDTQFSYEQSHNAQPPNVQPPSAQLPNERQYPPVDYDANFRRPE